MEKNDKEKDNEDFEFESSGKKKSKFSNTRDIDSQKEISEKSEKISNKSNHNQKASFFNTEKVEVSDVDKENKLDFDAEEEPHLNEEEVHEATLVLADALMQETAEELEASEPDTPEEFEALASAIFLEELIEIAEGRENFTEDSLQQAFNEASQDISLDENIPEHVNALTSIDDEEVEGDIGRTASSATANTPIVPSTNLPPTVQPSVPRNNQSLPPSGNTHFQTHNNQPPNFANAKSIVRTETVEINYGHRSDMLVGAILGYIIGRRGGRKRTEKKLQPKIDKLKEDATILQDSIIKKDAQIRQLARKNYLLAKNLESKTSQVTEQRKAKKQVKEILKRREELASDPGVEKIGKFSLPALKVFHERRLPDGNENSPKRKQVEIMNETELLDKVAGLQIHGLLVADMYKKKRLTLNMLRQITKEYLRGGPFRQTFSMELLPDETEIEQNKRRIENAHNNSPSSTANAAVFSNSKSSNNVIEANKLADALMMTQKRPSQQNSKKFIISGVITGIVVASAIVAMMLIG